MVAPPPPLDSLGGWPGILSRLAAGSDLRAEEASAALGDVLDGGATPSQIAAFIFGLRCKGETVEEMTGLVGAMLAVAERVVVDEPLASRLVDTCGTGGDRHGTINVSTLAALVVAGAGVPVCKHGGRAASSRAGSADLLEALGVAIELPPAGVARCIVAAGIGFCFAPRYHRALRHAAPTRRELGVPTAFNFLGPLANPAAVTRQVVGVGDPAMAAKMCSVLAAAGSTHVMVVHGSDGLDELTTTGPSTVVEWQVGEGVRHSVLDPAELGIHRSTMAELVGGDAARNADLARWVLDGVPGPQSDIVALNAAAGLMVAGVADDMRNGLEMARASLADGHAAAALDTLVAESTAAAKGLS